MPTAPRVLRIGLIGGSGGSATPLLAMAKRGVAEAAPGLDLLRDSIGHPLVRRGWPDDAPDRLLRVWEERDLYLDALDRLPQTFCHFDLFRRNLFVRRTADGRDQTVAVDWAFAGLGPIGQELVPLVQGSLPFYEVGLDQALEIERIVLEGYLGGLCEAGWRGDPRLVRLGYAAAAWLRYNCGGEIDRLLGILLDESLHETAKQAFGRPIGQVLDHGLQVDRLFSGLVDEARELIEALG